MASLTAQEKTQLVATLLETLQQLSDVPLMVFDGTSLDQVVMVGVNGNSVQLTTEKGLEAIEALDDAPGNAHPDEWKALGESKPHRGYVMTATGEVFVQRPADNRWGFELLDDDQTFPGGLGIDGWVAVSPDQVSAEDKDRLGWLLETEDA